MVLEANTIVIIVAVAVVALVLFFLLRGRGGRGGEGVAEREAEGAPARPEPPRRAVASKEVFAPLPEPVRDATEPVRDAPEPQKAKPEPEVKVEAPVETPAPPVAVEVASAREEAAVPKPEVTPALTTPEAKPPVAEAKPPVAEAKPPVAEAKPEPAKVEPKPEPAKVETKPEPAKAETKPEPAKAETKPPKAEAKPATVDAKPAKPTKAEAKPAKPTKAEAKPAKPTKAEAKPAKPTKAEAKPAKADGKVSRAGSKKADDDVPWELREDDDEGAEALPKKEKEDEGPERTLADGLGRTRKEGFIAKLGNLFKRGRAVDDDLMDEVEEVLFTADIGVRTADRLMSKVREALSKKEMKDVDKVWSVLRDEALTILEAPSPGAARPATGPEVIMVLGVNGTGKTTSIGKLANRLRAEGRSVLLVAGDTFRAAAAEQLEHWGRRVGVEVFRGKEGQDPASVVFDGVRKGLEDTRDVILVDTAGRLHNNTNLMEELKKVRRVMGKAIDGAPHEVLLVLDATTGQNAVVQAKQFKAATEVTGVVLTKLDGTAKGGVVLGVCDELGIPVRWVGIGERVADLRAFDAREFVDELFQPPT